MSNDISNDISQPTELHVPTRKLFRDWNAFSYTFVDKVGEKRPIPAVISVDLCKSQNGTSHHTDKFFINRQKDNQLVIRRGQPFTIKVSFATEYDNNQDIMRLLLQIGKCPMVSQTTEVLIPVYYQPNSKEESSYTWTASMTNKTGRKIYISITPPSDCIIGVWSLEIQTIRQEDIHTNYVGDPIMNRFQSNSLYVLFNPWCQDDSVFMRDNSLREEYVLNDVGKIWRGAASSFRPCVWNFGQYESNILDACMVLLDWSKIRYRHRSSPVHIARVVSAMVNANDDLGVLIGNWSGDYSDGTPPTDWQGSVQILQRWFNGNAEPVMYGQCWVFSGVTTTIMRALGIPTRSVTNFASAHDTDANLTIDHHFNEKGKHVKDLDNDSVWNFHVWNDCWMNRPDLPKGYGGWQAIDATPQETSEGIFRTGPASLVAVRRGHVGYQFDTAFVFAEVNADKVYWLYRSKTEPLEFIDLDRLSIGKNISTRKPGPLMRGNLDRLDITDEYKLTEMSEEERMSVMNAVCKYGSSSSSIYNKKKMSDVLCELELKEEVTMGQDFNLSVKVQNKSNEKRTVKTCLRVDAMQYTGIIVKRIAKDYSEVILQPLEEKFIALPVKADQYIGKLQDQGSMLMSAMLHIKETGQTYHAEDDFRICFPEISITVKDRMVVGKPAIITANFTNPLNKYLIVAKFIFESPGLAEPREIRISNIGRNKMAEASWEVIPTESGKFTILVSFTSLQLRDIDGSTEVEVYAK
uniref:protein-glutamine gamma-glutamyltransferase n=1 Tax=Strigamia maritima TaxID=126957 RepID=T1IVX6_STRMM